MKKTLLLLSLLLLQPAALYADTSVQRDIVKATLVSEHNAIVSGQPFRVGVLLEPKEGWHTYYKNPGDAGLPTRLIWTLPEGFVAGEIDWPSPTRIAEKDLVTFGYEGRVMLPVTITAPAELEESYPIAVKAEWLVCKDICIPESAELEIMLPTAFKARPTQYTELFHEAPKPQPAEPEKPLLLPLALLFAVLGGLILNLMPCVLPILSLKALAVVKKAGHEPKTVMHMGIAYTLGIMFSFAVIAGILIALQQAGEAVGWGYQMQSPPFVGFLIFLLFLVGLNLSGLFHLPVLLGNVGSDVANESSARGSFFTGILATAVATPCTAPFMASAVGVALTLSPIEAMLIFEALGFGLALPFLAISLFPQLLRFLPKPGAWMETFKQLLAFPMYVSVIWLLWVLTLQTGASGMVIVLCGMLAIIIAIWMKPLFGTHNIAYRVTALITYLAIFTASLSSLSQMEINPAMPMIEKVEKMGVETVEFSKEKLAQLQGSGKPVFVNATAAWCITCQVNGRIAIHTTRTLAAFKEHGVTLMIADWTRRNDEITEFLSSFGYKGVPLYVFYPAAGGEPVILPQLLTEDTVINAISR